MWVLHAARLGSGSRVLIIVNVLLGHREMFPCFGGGWPIGGWIW